MGVGRVRSEFPALRRQADRLPPVYLDSACMSLVPRRVLDAMQEYYRDYPGCAGRSLHRFAEAVGQRYESSREAFSKFLHAEGPDSIVFVRNATEAINIVGQGLDWKAGDRVLISDQEHNSNLILWQRLVKERGIRLDVFDLTDDGSFDGDRFSQQLTGGVRLVSLFHTSNLDGRSLPIAEVTERAHAAGAKVLVDGCQAAPHQRVDLLGLGVDYYALSLHKMMGPTGTGILAGRKESLAELRPLLLGGETVEWSTLTDHELRPPPHRFEAGLQNYAGVLGARAALSLIEEVGLEEIQSHDRQLNARVTRGLKDEPRVKVLGPADPKARSSIYAFHVDGVDANDGALFLDEGHRVLVRSGRHCVHSWYTRRGLSGNIRASFYLYNTRADADALVAGVREMVERIPGSSAPASPGTAS
jgi:cysteine desulfurase/selenocysteine lyase